MKRISLLIACIALIAHVTSATIVSIQVSDFKFTPATQTAQVGDTIRWFWGSGSHTTTSATIPAGAIPWDTPINLSNPVFQYKLTVAGTYFYICTPHVSIGMTGTLIVSAAGIATVGDIPARIAPNPANSVVEVALPGQSQDVMARLRDLQGRLVFEGSVPSGKTLSIPTSNVPTGLYLLTLYLDQRRISTSVVVRH